MNNKGFNSSYLRNIFIAQASGYIGESFANLALTWFIVKTGSVTQVGINLALTTLPNILLAPLIGGLVDRWSRKRVLWVCDILRASLDVVLILFIAQGWFSIYIIYTYTVLKTILRLLHRPAQRAVIQQLSEGEGRVKANAWEQFSFNGGNIVGPVLAGLAIKYFSITWVIAFDALSFLLSAAFLFVIKIDESHIVKKQGQSYFKEFKEGVGYVRVNRWILILSLGLAFVNTGAALSYVAQPYLVSDVLNMGSDALGYITSIGFVGALLVSMLLTKLKQKGHTLNYIIIGCLIRGVGTMALALAGAYWVVLVICFCHNAGKPLLAVYNQAFHQEHVPSDYMGRVFAVRVLISTLAMPVGSLFGAALVSGIGVMGSFIVSGLIICCGSVFAIWAKVLHNRVGLGQIEAM